MKCVVEKCNRQASFSDGKCYIHSGDTRERRALASSKGGKHSRRKRSAKNALDTIEQARSVLVDAINEVRQKREGDSLSRLRALTAAVNTLTHILEKSELIARVKRLLKEEEASGHRKSAG